MVSRRPPRKYWFSRQQSARTRAMSTVILVVHIMLALALIGVILVQQSEGGALGMGGGGMSGFMTGRSAANLLTRTTAILAACFFATSITLALLQTRDIQSRSIIDTGPPAGQTAPGPLSPTPSTTPVLPAPTGNAAPTPAPAPSGAPAVPLAK